MVTVGFREPLKRRLVARDVANPCLRRHCRCPPVVQEGALPWAAGCRGQVGTIALSTAPLHAPGYRETLESQPIRGAQSSIAASLRASNILVGRRSLAFCQDLDPNTNRPFAAPRWCCGCSTDASRKTSLRSYLLLLPAHQY